MPELVTYRGVVYPWHCDHVGHMNVMWYVGKFDEATWSLFFAIGVTSSYAREQKRSMAALQQNITYKRELHAGDVVEVKSSMIEVRDKTVRFLHEMRNVERDEVAALCELTAAHLDLGLRKACPFPPEIRAAAEGLVPAEA